MNPALIDEMGYAMGQVYAEITDEIIVNMAKHFPYIKDDKEIKGSFEYQSRMLAQMGKLNAETVDIITKRLSGADEELRRKLETAITESLKDSPWKAIFEDTGDELRDGGWEEVRGATGSLIRQMTLTPTHGGGRGRRETSSGGASEIGTAQKGLMYGEGLVSAPMSANQTRAFKTYYAQAADKLNMVNTVMLESTKEAYRATVADVAQRIDKTQGILNTGAGEVISGASAYNQAFRRAVKRMSENGLTGFIDHGGHKWSPEAYVAMDIRTTMFNAAREAVFEENERYGNDLYYVSSHDGARPLCYPWQGKVISRTDEAREVRDLNGDVIQVYAQSQTSYGEPAGLFGINCRHYPISFIPNFSTIKGDKQNPEDNAKAYEETQKQRALERRLREEKRELETLKAQGADDKDIEAQSARVRRASADLWGFLDETGRNRNRSREYTPVQTNYDGAKIPPYGVGVTNVTNEYRVKAKPSSGLFIREDGYKAKGHDAEIDIARQLHKYYGGDITLNAETAKPGVYTADYTWNGALWEQKTIHSAKAADKATRHGLKQIADNPGGLVFKCESGVDYTDALQTILHRIKGNEYAEKLDIFIYDAQGKPHIYRVRG